MRHWFAYHTSRTDEGIALTAHFKSLSAAEQERLGAIARAAPERHRPLYVCHCETCGVDFLLGRDTQVWSCRECARKRRAAAQRKRRLLKSGRAKLKWERDESPFNPSREVIVAVPFACKQCGASFTPQRNTARYCSVKCRMRAYRARK